MSKEIRVGYLLIDAYRGEASLFREEGKETRAETYARAADRMEKLTLARRAYVRIPRTDQ